MEDGEEFWILLRSLSFLLRISYEGQVEGQVLDVGFGSHAKARRREGGMMDGLLRGWEAGTPPPRGHGFF
jgi:hypothetical protein